MKSFAEIKRSLTVGRTLTMTHNSWARGGYHRLLDLPRKIIHVQSNAIQFEGGSWLYLDQKASMYFDIPDVGFGVYLDPADLSKTMTYKFD